MNKPDCLVGFGYNKNLKISDIARKTPEYLRILYNGKETPDEVKKVIEYYLPKKEEETMAKAKTKTETETETVENTENIENLSLLKKINLIRKACSEKDIEKEGKGKAGGNSKYDYYKAQQVIDFYLNEEIKYDLFSEFKVTDTMASYRVIDIPTGETTSVECPFDIPRKMAASEAQQVGAALTYYNRRLAMMMYKIEDNSKENVDVLENADFSAKEIPAPIIPVPPIIMPPPIGNVAPPVTPDKGEPMTDAQVDELIHEQEVNANDEVIAPPAPPVAPVTPPISPVGYIDPKDLIDGKIKNGVKIKEPVAPPPAPPAPPVAPPPAPKTSIESLYD